MIDIKLLRENPEKVKKACENKGAKIDIDEILELDKKRRELIQEIEKLKAEQKKLGKEHIEKAKELKNKIKELEPELKKVEQEFQIMFSQIPNIPLDDVPVGKNDSENKVIREVGKKPDFGFKPKDYLEIAEKLDIIDIKRAGNISGTRFGYLKGGLALLEFALIQFAFEIATSEKILKKIANSIKKNYSAKPFIPIVPPVMIKPETYTRMARLGEEDKGERYYIPSDDIYLIGSAEHTLGPLHMDEVLDEKNLPIRYCGFSTCFRREAGSYGKDTKGILRVHQFDKVEMVSFTSPENSVLEQDFIVEIQEYLMKSLEIPYRVMMICTGDMGKPDARQIDIESWMPGQNEYRETHTSDMNTDYQARRLNTRIKTKNGKLEFAHMNDATAFAIGRTLIAIIENYQQKDGSIKVPKILRKYTGIKCITTK